MNQSCFGAWLESVQRLTADWGNTSGGEQNVPANSFDAIGRFGVEPPLTTTDSTELNVMGFAVASCAAGTRIAVAGGVCAGPMDARRLRTAA